MNTELANGEFFPTGLDMTFARICVVHLITHEYWHNMCMIYFVKAEEGALVVFWKNIIYIYSIFLNTYVKRCIRSFWYN